MHLTDKQSVFLEEVPEWMHKTIIDVWQDYSNRKNWNSGIERSKAEYAFYMGISTCLTMSTPKSPISNDAAILTTLATPSQS
jgi:hypothetical protein